MKVYFIVIVAALWAGYAWLMSVLDGVLVAN